MRFYCAGFPSINRIYLTKTYPLSIATMEMICYYKVLFVVNKCIISFFFILGKKSLKFFLLSKNLFFFYFWIVSTGGMCLWTTNLYLIYDTIYANYPFSANNDSKHCYLQPQTFLVVLNSIPNRYRYTKTQRIGFLKGNCLSPCLIISIRNFILCSVLHVFRI